MVQYSMQIKTNTNKINSLKYNNEYALSYISVLLYIRKKNLTTDKGSLYSILVSLGQKHF